MTHHFGDATRVLALVGVGASLGLLGQRRSGTPSVSRTSSSGGARCAKLVSARFVTTARESDSSGEASVHRMSARVRSHGQRVAPSQLSPSGGEPSSLWARLQRMGLLCWPAPHEPVIGDGSSAHLRVCRRAIFLASGSVHRGSLNRRVQARLPRVHSAATQVPMRSHPSTGPSGKGHGRTTSHERRNCARSFGGRLREGTHRMTALPRRR